MYPLICFKILLLIATVALRSTAITSLTTTYLGESGRYASAALVYDTRWIALCGLLMLLSYATRNRWVWGCLQWLSGGVIALAVLDLYIFQTTWQRLSWDGVITFGGEWSAAVDLFVKNLHKPDVLACSALLGVALLLLLAEPVVLWRLPPLKSPRRVYVALGSPALLALAVAPTPWLESRALGTIKPLAVDVLTYQWAYSTPPAVDAATKAAFIERYAALHPAAQPQCPAGWSRQGHVVLVIMESLSSHHSLRVAGLHDWTPKIDEIFAPGWTFKNFYANGFRTDLGLAAILTGVEPVAGDATGSSIYLNAPGAKALPARLRHHGYSTHFISGSSLFFLDIDQWLPGIGFEHLHGPQPAPGETKQNYAFQVWPDQQTYDATLKIMQQTPAPGLFVVNTMSSHMPYQHQETLERGEQAAMAYADQAFADFYRQLERQGFFRQGGLLVLTGDHRSMTPISAEERDRYGASAPARVPLFVLAENLPPLSVSLITTPLQQADLPASLEYWAGSSACLQWRQRNIFALSVEQPQRCIVHMRGDNQRYLNIFCGERMVEVEMSAQGAQATTDQQQPPGLSEALDDLIARRLGMQLH
ncbi:phosphoglycerol transferase MdoB-like AlkP superfamily enzyme [Simplicispira metamorpha]|uniref:Phosphoglycerol transferase MdoB-like AlkP superfamily enzyme n=1 Tax=Simplicispira metamorpha TaxID=80881 RepID=A0A4R2NGH2_9BURK|nr:phosphoglycerol transferase MdoB-like AlkP superfamily enzyme [Simplicispira metamorpha]